MAYEFDTSVGRLNQRKLYKWLFLLFQKHHERLGLKAFCWTGPDGIGTARMALFFQRGNEPPLGSQIPAFDMHLYQHAIAIRKEPGGEAAYPKMDQSSVELRTQSTLRWLESELGIISKSQQKGILPLPQAESPWWPAAAARYLRSWNVLGLVLNAIPEFVRLESLGATLGYGQDGAAESRWARNFYPEVSQTDILHFKDHKSGDPIFWLHSGRVCKSSGRSLDLNVLNDKGLEPRAIANEVREFVPDLGGVW